MYSRAPTLERPDGRLPVTADVGLATVSVRQYETLDRPVAIESFSATPAGAPLMHALERSRCGDGAGAVAALTEGDLTVGSQYPVPLGLGHAAVLEGLTGDAVNAFG